MSRRAFRFHSRLANPVSETYEVPTGTRVRWISAESGTEGPDVSISWQDQRDDSIIAIHASDPSGLAGLRYGIETPYSDAGGAEKPGWGSGYEGPVRVPRNRRLRVAARDLTGNLAIYVATESAARSGTSSP